MYNTIIVARISLEEKQLLKKICVARGEDLSVFVRRSIRKELASLGYLSNEQKKALGIQTFHHEVIPPNDRGEKNG